VNCRTRNRRSPLICLLLAGITSATCWPLRHCDFVKDDDDFFISNNPPVRAGLTWEGIRWAFGTTEFGNWLPLTRLSHMLDCQFYGLQPVGYHLKSLLLHVANVLLLFPVLGRVTATLWRSAVVAALFALHPLRVDRWPGWTSGRMY